MFVLVYLWISKLPLAAKLVFFRCAKFSFTWFLKTMQFSYLPYTQCAAVKIQYSFRIEPPHVWLTPNFKETYCKNNPGCTMRSTRYLFIYLQCTEFLLLRHPFHLRFYWEMLKIKICNYIEF